MWNHFRLLSISLWSMVTPVLALSPQVFWEP